MNWWKWTYLKFIYSEKATKFCNISTLLLTVCTVVKSMVEISQNFVAFSEYMNFNIVRSYLVFALLFRVRMGGKEIGKSEQW